MFARYTASQVTAYATWGGTLPLLVFLPGFGSAVANADPAPLLATVYIGVFPAALAYVIFSYALSRAPVTLVTGLSLIRCRSSACSSRGGSLERCRRC